MIDAVLRGDAFRLPFRDVSFDVVVADPPYAGRNRGKKGVGYKESGYVPFTGREWWHEAWRVLRPSGHLYVFCAVKELRAWHREIDEETIDTISWIAPNNPSLSAYWRRGTGGRAPAWRPALHWQRAPRTPLQWKGVTGPRVNSFNGNPLRGDGGLFIDPNVFVTASVQSNMGEALPWPNQLPVKLLAWLLRPHRGARILDLFAGTGTTREAAVGLGLGVVSVDLSPEAVALTRSRAVQHGWALETSAPSAPPVAQEEFRL